LNSRVGCFLRLLVAAVLFCVLLGVGAGLYWYFGPFKGYAGETFIEINRGTTTQEIAQTLAHEGVVRSRWAFLAVRALQPGAKLQAGEYRFGSAATPWQVFNKIRRGEVFYQDVTFPEGSNMFDMAAVLAATGTVAPKAFLAAAGDPAMIRDLDPKAASLEGYLFPSTYRLTHQSTAGQLCTMMTGEFRKRWKAVGGDRRNSEVHDIVTMASLVEKEAALPAERPIIASVFENRLRLNMLLQCDPTTVYAALLENRYRGTIYKSDLTSTNPYNTYTHPGLPPGPICNPGIASLKAALQPAQTNYVYFVAKGDGSGAHHFSATLAEHDQAVAAYRKTSH
jgi:UPF0755 protein